MATTLAGVASVLSAVAGVAETVAQELRLTLPEDGGRTDEGPVTAPGRWSDGTGPRLEDVTGAGEVDGVEAPPADEDVRVRVLDDEEVARLHPATPEPVIDTGLDEDVQVIKEAPVEDEYPEEPGVAEPGPEPWVEDVAEAVAGGTVREAIEKLPELTDTQLRALERYERDHRARVTLLRAVDDELTSRD